MGARASLGLLESSQLRLESASQRGLVDLRGAHALLDLVEEHALHGGLYDRAPKLGLGRGARVRGRGPREDELVLKPPKRQRSRHGGRARRCLDLCVGDRVAVHGADHVSAHRRVPADPHVLGGLLDRLAPSTAQENARAEPRRDEAAAHATHRPWDAEARRRRAARPGR